MTHDEVQGFLEALCDIAVALGPVASRLSHPDTSIGEAPVIAMREYAESRSSNTSMLAEALNEIAESIRMVANALPTAIVLDATDIIDRNRQS